MTCTYRNIKKIRVTGQCTYILGHSIPPKDKQELVRTFQEYCPAPIISLLRNCDALVDGVDYEVEPDPKKLLQLIAVILPR